MTEMKEPKGFVGLASLASSLEEEVTEPSAEDAEAESPGVPRPSTAEGFASLASLASSLEEEVTEPSAEDVEAESLARVYREFCSFASELTRVQLP